MKKIALALTSLVVLGCGKKDSFVYYDDPKPREYFKRSFDVTQMQQEKMIDILWVVDNSGSMGDIQNNIVHNSALFMDNFKKNKIIEWKMGVMSTDISEDPTIGFRVPFDYTLQRQNPPVDPTPLFENAIDFLGTNGSASEYVFKNVHRAWEDYFKLDIRGNKVYDFFRKDAHLVVIMVTDEEAQSESRYGAQYTPDNVISTIGNLMRGYSTQGTDKVLRFYGAFQMKDLQGCNSSSWDNTTYKGSPFETIINNTGGFVISACETDFGLGLADIGKDILGIVRMARILLDERPKPETIKVFYRGEELKGGSRHDDEKALWYYDEYYNRINFYSMEFMQDNDQSDIKVEFEINDGVQRD